MSRSAPLLVIAVVLAIAPAALAGPKEDDLARARVLDQQGVRAYKEGRYNDAIVYFSEAFKLGGPPSELWNIAKCHLRLDQPQEANDAYERYLMQPGLSAQDKAEATAQMEELRRRRSILTVASTPSHAVVFLDGKRGEPAGTTPFSVQVAPGVHRIDIEQKGYRSYTEDVEAKFGRAVIVDAQLKRDPNATPEKPAAPVGPRSPSAAPSRFTAQAEMGVVFSKLGSYAEAARFGFGFGAAYWFVDGPRTLLGLGVRLDVATDGWGNTINAAANAPGCAQPIPVSETSTEISGFGVGFLGYRATPRLRLGADAGLGIAGYTASNLGGDLFYPTCTPSTGAQVAGRAGLEVSYSILPMLRALATPLSVAVHPAFGGARNSPLDASGPWLRFGVSFGLAVDL